MAVVKGEDMGEEVLTDAELAEIAVKYQKVRTHWGLFGGKTGDPLSITLINETIPRLLATVRALKDQLAEAESLAYGPEYYP